MVQPALALSRNQSSDAPGFAYGGSVIQDVGYYPLGNQVSTNFPRYARSGDFVSALVHEARDINEYAFALEALGHHVANSWGHTAVNLATPLLYPKLRKKYGERPRGALNQGKRLSDGG